MSAKSKGGRPPLPKNRRRNTQLNLRIKDDLKEKLDAKARELEETHPGMNWSRCDVARYMLYRAFLGEEE